MIVTFIPDLMVASKLNLAVRHYGVTCRQTASEADFTSALRDTANAKLIVIDADVEGIDAPKMIRSAREAAPAAKVVAFCSHVLGDLIKDCRDAGAVVMANSTFAAGVPGLIAPLAPAEP